MLISECLVLAAKKISLHLETLAARCYSQCVPFGHLFRPQHILSGGYYHYAHFTDEQVEAQQVSECISHPQLGNKLPQKEALETIFIVSLFLWIRNPGVAWLVLYLQGLKRP